MVRSVVPGGAGYLDECADGEPGQLVCRGGFLMSGYVGDAAATKKAIHTEAGGWYVNLGDVCFALPAADGRVDQGGGARGARLGGHHGEAGLDGLGLLLGAAPGPLLRHGPELAVVGALVDGALQGAHGVVVAAAAPLGFREAVPVRAAGAWRGGVLCGLCACGLSCLSTLAEAPQVYPEPLRRLHARRGPSSP